MKSTDRGEDWTSITSDLPPRGSVYTIAQDHVNPKLLFVGTEFGVFFTVDEGKQWIQLKGGLPIIAVRDIALQRREHDVVLGTFGRGFYLLDDYTPLRTVSEELLQQGPVVFPVKPALRYIETSRLGGGSGRGSQGASFFAADNPSFGATFTYYLKEKITTRKEHRQEVEKQAVKQNAFPPFPTVAELRAEDEEKEPAVLLIVQDDTGATVRRIAGPRDKGFQRVAWDLRYPSCDPTSLHVPEDRPPWWRPPAGPLALPGTYTMTLCQQVDEVVTPLAEPVEFEVIPLNLATFAAEDRAEVLAFQTKVARLVRALEGAQRAAGEGLNRVEHLRQAVKDTPALEPTLLARLEDLRMRLNRINTELSGDRTLRKREDPSPLSLRERVREVMSNQLSTTSPPTETQRVAYLQAGKAFADVLKELRTLMLEDLVAVEQQLEAAGAPWTPGRFPTWEIE